MKSFNSPWRDGGGEGGGLGGREARRKRVARVPPHLIELAHEGVVHSVAELLLERVEENAHELLHVVLGEGVGALPAEGLGQGAGAHRTLVGECHLGEQELELERNAVRLAIAIFGFELCAKRAGRTRRVRRARLVRARTRRQSAAYRAPSSGTAPGETRGS